MDFFGSESSFGHIRSAAYVDPNVFGKVYIPEWNVTCGSRLDTAVDCRWIVDGFALPIFFADIHRWIFNYLKARQTTFSVEIWMRAECRSEKEVFDPLAPPG